MKKNLTFSKLLMLVVIAVLPLSMMAQKVGNKNLRPAEKYWYIQADGGLSINHGDLANYNGGIWDDFDHFMKTAKEPTWNAHLGVGYQLGKVVGLNLKGGYGLLSGHKHQQALVLNGNADQTLWNLGLDQSNYIEANLNLTFNLFNLFSYNPRRVFNLVPHIGFGGIYYQGGDVNQLNADEEVTTTLARKADRELSYTVPAGMEINFNLTPKFDLFLDYTYTFTGTDNLDQVAKIAADEEFRIINDKDMYSQFNLGLRYKFNEPCDIEKMAQKEIEVRAEPNPLVKGEDGNVCFDVIVTIPEEYFQKKAVLNLRPYFSYNGGEIELPEPIIFIGEKVKTSDKYDYQVTYKDGGEFTKHYCIPFQEEMAECELMGDPMFYIYDGNVYQTQDEIANNAYFAQGKTVKLADGVEVPHVDPIDPDPNPDPNPGPEETPEADLVYYFAKDKWDIRNTDPTKTARQNLAESINSGEEITGFKIVGWASPEGEDDHNHELSDKRADAAVNDITDQLKRKLGKNANDYTYETIGKGPDWDKFEELVEASDLADKDAILSQIRNSGNKEQAIKDIIEVYPVLEKQILPLIRRAEVFIIK
jgi:outer membrane protein OmpA-like peptidoglycan-associated protein